MTLQIDSAWKRRCFRYRLLVARYQRGSVDIARGSILLATDVTIGSGTRISGPCLAKGSANLEIGRYCAIGSDVTFITTNHLTTPLNLSLALQRRLGAARHVAAEQSSVTIGHAAWIGDGALILPGVRVGIGAIVGAGSVVTRSVPDFQLAVGNPARMIRSRWSTEVTDAVSASRWWELEPKELAEHADLFDQPDLASDSVASLARLRAARESAG